MAACVVEPGMQVHVLEEAGLRRWVAELVSRADVEAFADPSYRRELATWVGKGVLGVPRPWAYLASAALRHVVPGARIAARDVIAVNSAPALIAITTEGDDRLTQVRTGMAFERMWLEATCMGLSVQPVSAPLQHPHVRRELAGLLGTPQRTPMVLFRVGYADPEKTRRPRRPVDEVLQID
jgi:nitroreductase